VKLAILTRLNQARDRREAAILVTDHASGDARLVVEHDGYAADPLAGDLAARFASGASGMAADGHNFLTVHLPPPRLVVIGAAHISQALAPMAGIAGFDVTIIDPRTAFATPERFAGIRVLAEWPDEVLKREPLDAHTALAVVSHDPKIDDFPLQSALQAGCFYVGALGSRKTHARRLDRFRQAGVAETLLSRIHAPIGLPIRAQSPAEIAVAILAEVISALRQRGLQRAEAVA
jgi:xanthine dehydrogenase accessory factor